MKTPRMYRGLRRVALVWVLATAVTAAKADPITPGGQQLAQFLEGLHVDQHWLPGVSVDWKTGDPADNGAEHASHCSSFVAAAAERLGIYILRPPEHGQTLLANAQHEWLKHKGAEKGWERIHSLVQAQAMANQGYLVVASYAAPDRHKPGHICIVRPADRTPEQIESEGPEVISAGMHNHNAIPMKEVFVYHPEAFAKREISLFVHPTRFSASGTGT